MGDTRAYAERVDLLHMTPNTTVCSTQFCLVNPGVEYLVYQPGPGLRFTIDLSAYPGGRFLVEWFGTVKPRISGSADVIAGTVMRASIPPSPPQCST